MNSFLPFDSPTVTVWRRLRPQPRETSRRFPWSTIATVRGDAVFRRRHEPPRNPPLVESSHREEEISPFHLRRGEKENRKKKMKKEHDVSRNHPPSLQ
ncbi:hypothetical protein F2Q68_00011745 [Brassica cretica]|uniref:Uncharacterized protein n=1 Tax=Brassica cretica TaxID=69181 RepID=A0A8S9L476_BRACR|nr:hypothetical protein F2Q68_00011745 [Brassica cretica]